MNEQFDGNAWLKGGSRECRVGRPTGLRPFRLVLLGAPGAGKGTQGEHLSALFGGCRLSTGDVFRAARLMDPALLSPKAIEALDFMKRGELVPDELVIDVVRERVACITCPYGFMLDGFPRTIAQAEALDELMVEHRIMLDGVLNFQLSTESVIERLSGRRTCSACRSTYHMVNMPPRKEGVCDKCGGELFQRADDHAESIRVRLEAYERSTAPLVDFYSRKGLLINISAEGDRDEVLERMLDALRHRFPELKDIKVPSL